MPRWADCACQQRSPFHRDMRTTLNYVCNASVPSLPDPKTRPRAFSGERTNNQSQVQYTIMGLNRQGKAFDTFVLKMTFIP